MTVVVTFSGVPMLGGMVICGRRGWILVVTKASLTRPVIRLDFPTPSSPQTQMRTKSRVSSLYFPRVSPRGTLLLVAICQPVKTSGCKSRKTKVLRRNLRISLVVVAAAQMAIRRAQRRHAYKRGRGVESRFKVLRVGLNATRCPGIWGQGGLHPLRQILYVRLRGQLYSMH